MWVMIGTIFIGATIWNGFGTIHHQGTAEFANFTSWFGFNRILAIWIVGTGIEKSEATTALGHEPFFTNRTSDTC